MHERTTYRSARHDATWAHRILPFGAALAMFGCQGPLEHGELLDEPMFSLSGTITPAPDRASVRIGVLWVDPAQDGHGNHASGSELVRHRIDPDGRYSLEFYDRPPEGSVRWLKAADGSDNVVAFAWGELILYEDRDGDGTFRVGPLAEGSPMVTLDVYRGMATSHVIVYVEKPLRNTESLIVGLSSFTGLTGYQLGFMSCRDTQLAWVDPILVPKGAVLQLLEASQAFPDLRPCMKSHPRAPID